MKSLPLQFNLKHEIQSSPIENIYKKIQSIMPKKFMKLCQF